MKIGTRLIGGFFILILGILAVFFIGMNGMSVINEHVDELVKDKFPKTVMADDITGAVNDAAQVVRNILIVDDPAVRKETDESLAKDNEIVNNAFQKLSKTVASAQGKSLFHNMEIERAKYKTAREEFFVFLASNQKDKAIHTLVYGDLKTYQNSYIKAVNDFTEHQVASVEETGKEASHENEKGLTSLLIVSVISVLIAIIIAFFLIRSITKPLSKAVDAAEKIAKGNLDVDLETKSKDETGILLNAMKKMADNINLLIDESKKISVATLEGKLDFRGNEEKFDGAFKEIVQGMNVTLDSVIGPLNIAAEYIDRISKGDIPPKITESYRGDFNEIKNNLNQCIDAFSVLVNETGVIIKAANDGNLELRVDADTSQGVFRKILRGLNETLDAVVVPINEAGNVLSIMSTGDLSIRMEGNYKGDLLKLKNDINTLADSLSSMIMQVTESVRQSANSSSEISSSAESLAAATQQQSAQADEVASAVEEMSRTITENAMSANRTAEMAQNNGKVAGEGGKVVHQTVIKMRDIAEVVKNSVDNIEKLGESSKQIGEIISVIDDIADQTNLLALNAAIEAARAGEQGRGFAVVADEVRKLAERTTEATKQIAKMIKGIQEETSQAVVAMNKGNEEVRSGIELADKAGESLQEILASTQAVLDMISQIAAASEEQSATAEQISKNVLSISKVTAESAHRVEDVAHTADDLAKITEELNQLVSKFKVGDSGYDSTAHGKQTKKIGRTNGNRYLQPSIDN